MSSSWWTRRASASDRSNTAPPPTIRTARSFDPSPSNIPSSSSSPAPSTPARSRTTSAASGRQTTSDGRTLTVIANALGFSGSSISKSKSRERLRALGTSSTPESSKSGSPSLSHTATFFASGAGTAPVAPHRRVPKSSTGPVPRSPNRQTVVSTASGSSWGATTSSADPPELVWEPTTPSSGSEAKHSFQSMGIGVGEDPFARSPVCLARESAPRKKDKQRPNPERLRRLAVSEGSAPPEDGSVSPLSLSPLVAFPPPPDMSRLPRRTVSALAAGGPRPAVTQRSNSAQPAAISLASPSLQPARSPLSPASQPLTPPQPPLTPSSLAASHPLTPTSLGSPLTPHSHMSTPTSPALHVDSSSPVSALQMHAHASALQDSESLRGSSVYYVGSDDEDREFGIRRGHSAHAILSRAHAIPREPPSATLPGLGRAGMSLGGAGMGSMVALATGIVVGLEGEPRAGAQSPVGGPPKRPSRSELRERASTNSLRPLVPPVRHSSLYPVPKRVASDGSSTTPTNSLSVSPASGNSPTASPATTPNASGQCTPSASAHPTQRPRATPTLDLPRTARATSPPPRVSEESAADLNHYTFAPMTEDADDASVELSIDYGHDLDGLGWLAHSPEDSQFLGTGSTPKGYRYGRRPPPSPTNLPWLAGNVGRHPTRRDAVYPSGVHIIPMNVMNDLARMGQEEDRVGDAVVARTVVEEEDEHTVEAANEPFHPLSSIEERFPTPPASAPPSSPSPVHPLTRLSSNSARSVASSCSSFAPEMVPPETISSRVEFSRHTRSGSYSDSELDLDLSLDKRARAPSRSRFAATATAVAWRCGAGNSQKCCGTRALTDGRNMGGWKCCAERAPNGKNARCCASFVGHPCERARVSSTSSASVHEAARALKRQRSFHLSSLPGIGSGSAAPGNTLHAPVRKNRFFHRPHTSHGKSTSSAMLEDDIRSLASVKSAGLSKEDPGPSMVPVAPDDVFASRPPANVTSPPLSPLGRQEFRAQYILSPSKLHDHLKKDVVAPSAPPPAPIEPGLKSPRLEPSRQRSNTATTAITTTTTDTSGSHRSALSTLSNDPPAPMRSLLPPRRVHNASLPSMTPAQPPEHVRRYVRSVSTVSQPTSSNLGPPPRSPALVPGLPPPPRGRVGMQPIVSFISPSSRAVIPGLKHMSSRESCESSTTLRRERSIPLRDTPMSFLDIEVEEEESEEDDMITESQWKRPALQHSQSFLDLSSRQSGDTMRENDAMFS